MDRQFYAHAGLLLAAMMALVSFDPGELAAQEKCKS